MALKWNEDHAVEDDGCETQQEEEQQQQQHSAEEPLSKRERMGLSLQLRVMADTLEKSVMPGQTKNDILGLLSTLGLALIVDDQQWTEKLFDIARHQIAADPEFHAAYEAEIQATVKQKRGLGINVDEILSQLGML